MFPDESETSSPLDAKRHEVTKVKQNTKTKETDTIICIGSNLYWHDVYDLSGVDDCVVCFGPFRKNNTVLLRECNHMFHKKCIKKCFDLKRECPMCRREYDFFIGPQPKGKMVVDRYPAGGHSLPGYESYGTAKIKFILFLLPRELGQGENEHTTQLFFQSLLPLTTKGLHLLEKLKVAFSRGLIFTIKKKKKGYGLESKIVEFKSKKHGARRFNGYPDPDYLNRLAAQLKLLPLKKKAQ
eukprot:TRINITY_DN3044_c0_g1_i3.p1 TRINITY_DN3044_c0_g1~~TRINITY_DN3044_c0_g1_i3.p1  ORF type:complete len:240 (+),score=31.32 TRINITY_DN3044_c0_g1_i3:370-1089(+)